MRYRLPQYGSIPQGPVPLLHGLGGWLLSDDTTCSAWCAKNGAGLPAGSTCRPDAGACIDASYFNTDFGAHCDNRCVAKIIPVGPETTFEEELGAVTISLFHKLENAVDWVKLTALEWSGVQTQYEESKFKLQQIENALASLPEAHPSKIKLRELQQKQGTVDAAMAAAGLSGFGLAPVVIGAIVIGVAGAVALVAWLAVYLADILAGTVELYMCTRQLDAIPAEQRADYMKVCQDTIVKKRKAAEESWKGIAVSALGIAIAAAIGYGVWKHWMK